MAVQQGKKRHQQRPALEQQRRDQGIDCVVRSWFGDQQAAMTGSAVAGLLEIALRCVQRTEWIV